MAIGQTSGRRPHNQSLAVLCVHRITDEEVTPNADRMYLANAEFREKQHLNNEHYAVINVLEKRGI